MDQILAAENGFVGQRTSPRMTALPRWDCFAFNCPASVSYSTLATPAPSTLKIGLALTTEASTSSATADPRCRREDSCAALASLVLKTALLVSASIVGVVPSKDVAPPDGKEPIQPQRAPDSRFAPLPHEGEVRNEEAPGCLTASANDACGVLERFSRSSKQVLSGTENVGSVFRIMRRAEDAPARRGRGAGAAARAATAASSST